MIINLIFADSSAPASFRSAVQTAALMLEKAITDPITVNIEVGYGHYPTDPPSVQIPSGAAEGDPATGDSFLYSDVLAALSAGKAPGDTNFDALPGDSVTGFNGNRTSSYSSVLVYPAQEKALGLGGLASNGTEIDGFVGFATDIAANALVGVALHELTHAIGRAPNGLPFDDNIPNIFDLFRFDTANNKRLVFDNGTASPAANFSVNGGGTVLANYGQTSDPSDFFSTTPTNDPFDKFYIAGATSQSLTPLDLTQLDVLGFNTIQATFSWTGGVSGDFAVGSKAGRAALSSSPARKWSSRAVSRATRSSVAAACCWWLLVAWQTRRKF